MRKNQTFPCVKNRTFSCIWRTNKPILATDVFLCNKRFFRPLLIVKHFFDDGNFHVLFRRRSFFSKKQQPRTFFLNDEHFFARSPFDERFFGFVVTTFSLTTGRAFFQFFSKKNDDPTLLVVRGWVMSGFSVASTLVLHFDHWRQALSASPYFAKVAIEIEVSYDFAPLSVVLPVLEQFCHHIW